MTAAKEHPYRMVDAWHTAVPIRCIAPREAVGHWVRPYFPRGPLQGFLPDGSPEGLHRGAPGPARHCPRLCRGCRPANGGCVTTSGPTVAERPTPEELAFKMEKKGVVLQRA